MSDSLFHFVFPLLAILATGLKIKHKIIIGVVLALIAVGLDADHFFGLEARGTFHNIYITLLLPLLLFGLAMRFEKRGTFWKHFMLIAVLVMFSHPAVDLFVGGAGVKLFYPFSDQSYLFNFVSVPITLPDGTIAQVVSSEGVGLSIFVLFVLGIIFTEDLVDILVKYKHHPERAVKRTVVKEERRIKKNL